MNNRQALYLLWATILNQSQKAMQVLLNTKELMNRLSLINDFENAYSLLTYEKIENAILLKPVLHRFPKNMSIYLYSSIVNVLENYSNVKDIFEGDNETVKQRLCSFAGIGKHKAETAIIIMNTYFRNNNRSNETIFDAKCIALQETIGVEIEILNELGGYDDK